MLILPAAAEPNPNPPSTQNDGSSPSAEAAPNPSTEDGSVPSAEASPNPSTDGGSDSSAEVTPSPPTDDDSAPSAESGDDAATETDPEGKEKGSNSPTAGATSSPPAAQPKAGTPAKPQDKAAAKPGSEPAAKEPGSQILINIDKAQQQMTVFVDGIEQHNWPISSGKRGYSTPSGTYTTTSMNEIWYSKEWDNAPMYNAIFFTKKGHAIHGTDEEKHLGKPASHGCVRVSRDNAKTLFALVSENGLSNTQVVLTGTTPGGEAKIAKRPTYRRYGEADPWFGPGSGYYYPPDYERPPPRRGIFGGWFRRDRPRDYGSRRYYYPPY